jgi:hypothetical protein
MTIDLADLADPRLASIIRRMPRLLTRFRKLKLFICWLAWVAGREKPGLTSLNSSEDIFAVLDAVIAIWQTKPDRMRLSTRSSATGTWNGRDRCWRLGIG